MYIARVKREYRARPYYYLRDSDNTVLISLGHTRNLERAYGEAMREYLKASQRLQAFEAVLPHFTPGASQRA